MRWVYVALLAVTLSGCKSSSEPKVSQEVQKLADQMEANLKAAKEAGIPDDVMKLEGAKDYRPNEDMANDLRSKNGEKILQNLGQFTNVGLESTTQSDEAHIAAQPVLDQIQFATKKRFLGNPKNIFDSSAGFPVAADAKQAVKLLTCDAVYWAQHGNAQRAKDRLTAASTIGDRMATFPTAIRVLVQAALRVIWNWNLTHCLNADRSLEFAKAVEPLAKSEGVVPTARQTIICEGFFGFRMAHSLEHDSSAQIDHYEDVNGKDIGGAIGKTELRAFESVVAQRFAWLLSEVGDSKLDDDRVIKLSTHVYPPIHFLGKDLKASFSDSYPDPLMVCKPILTAKGRQIVGLALVRAAEYRATHGELPTKIEQLGDLPLDHRTKKPLRLIKSRKGIRIYAIGMDGIDHGGKTRKELKSEDDAGDLVEELYR